MSHVRLDHKEDGAPACSQICPENHYFCRNSGVALAPSTQDIPDTLHRKQEEPRHARTHWDRIMQIELRHRAAIMPFSPSPIESRQKRRSKPQASHTNAQASPDSDGASQTQRKRDTNDNQAHMPVRHKSCKRKWGSDPTEVRRQAPKDTTPRCQRSRHATDCTSQTLWSRSKTNPRHTIITQGQQDATTQ